MARNPLLAALLLVTFFARALVPAGFMPGPGGLIVCNGYMPAPEAGSPAMMHDMSMADMSGMDMAGMDMPGMAHHGDRTPHHGGSTDHESSVCPFAAAATTMAGNHAAVFTASVAADTGALPIPEQRFIPRGTIVPTRLPRGPPSFA